jgi:hypothetical protein
MDTDLHIQAVRRYGALVGDLEDASFEEREQARADRDNYSEYIPGHGCGWGKAALLLRFLHEIYHIPLWQARGCTVVVFQQRTVVSPAAPTLHSSRTASCRRPATCWSLRPPLPSTSPQPKKRLGEEFWKEVLLAMTYDQPMEAGMPEET